MKVNLLRVKKKEKGKYIWENGDYYIGEFLNDMKNGKGKIYYKNDSIKYDGDFVNDKYEGKGKFIWENEEYYIGEWVNGFKHGEGIIYYKNNKIKYKGNFVNNEYYNQIENFYNNNINQKKHW